MEGPRAMELMRHIHRKVCHLTRYKPQFKSGRALLHKENIKDLMSHVRSCWIGLIKRCTAIVDLKIEWVPSSNQVYES